MAFVAPEIVHDDDIAGLEGGHEKLFDPCGEALAVDRSIEHAWCIDPVVAEGCEEGQRAPFAERRSGDQLLAARCPAPDRRHVGLRPGLIDEDQTPGIKPALIFLPLSPPARDLRSQLLDGEQRFF